MKTEMICIFDKKIIKHLASFKFGDCAIVEECNPKLYESQFSDNFLNLFVPE